LQSKSDVSYIDAPKNQESGVRYCCMCVTEQREPTHDSDAMGHVFYWCKRCGLYLLNKDMDDYYGSELFKTESARRKQMREEGSLVATK
jgi:hypothetical protein